MGRETGYIRRRGSDLLAQEYGTIEAGSKVEVTVSGNGCRSRSNSIRRSKALERMMGKRAMTFSRTVRKSDAIKATFCRCVRKRARFGDGLVQKDPAIKRLMLGTNERKPGIGIEIFACQKDQPHRQIGKLRKPLGFFRVCDKTSRIDENLALIEARMKNIAEQLGRIGHPPFRRQHVEAERTAEFSVNIDSERPGIGRIVITIADALRTLTAGSIRHADRPCNASNRADPFPQEFRCSR